MSAHSWSRASSSLRASARRLGSFARTAAPQASDLAKVALVSAVNPRLQLLHRPVLLSTIVGGLVLIFLVLLAALQRHFSCKSTCTLINLPRLRELSDDYTCSTLELHNFLLADSTGSSVVLDKHAYRLLDIVGGGTLLLFAKALLAFSNSLKSLPFDQLNGTQTGTIVQQKVSIVEPDGLEILSPGTYTVNVSLVQLYADGPDGQPLMHMQFETVSNDLHVSRVFASGWDTQRTVAAHSQERGGAPFTQWCRFGPSSIEATRDIIAAVRSCKCGGPCFFPDLGVLAQIDREHGGGGSPDPVFLGLYLFVLMEDLGKTMAADAAECCNEIPGSITRMCVGQRARLLMTMTSLRKKMGSMTPAELKTAWAVANGIYSQAIRENTIFFTSGNYTCPPNSANQTNLDAFLLPDDPAMLYIFALYTSAVYSLYAMRVIQGWRQQMQASLNLYSLECCRQRCMGWLTVIGSTLGFAMYIEMAICFLVVAMYLLVRKDERKQLARGSLFNISMNVDMGPWDYAEGEGRSTTTSRSATCRRRPKASSSCSDAGRSTHGRNSRGTRCDDESHHCDHDSDDDNDDDMSRDGSVGGSSMRRLSESGSCRPAFSRSSTFSSLGDGSRRRSMRRGGSRLVRLGSSDSGSVKAKDAPASAGTGAADHGTASASSNGCVVMRAAHASLDGSCAPVEDGRMDIGLELVAQPHRTYTTAYCGGGSKESTLAKPLMVSPFSNSCGDPAPAADVVGCRSGGDSNSGSSSSVTGGLRGVLQQNGSGKLVSASRLRSCPSSAVSDGRSSKQPLTVRWSDTLEVSGDLTQQASAGPCSTGSIAGSASMVVQTRSSGSSSGSVGVASAMTAATAGPAASRRGLFFRRSDSGLPVSTATGASQTTPALTHPHPMASVVIITADADSASTITASSLLPPPVLSTPPSAVLHAVEVSGEPMAAEDAAQQQAAATAGGSNSSMLISSVHPAAPPQPALPTRPLL